MKTENFISENSKKIGLMISGGLDSSLLLYLITKEIKDKNLSVEFITYTVNQPAKNSVAQANRIIETVERLNDVKIKNVVVGNLNAHTDYEIVYGVLDALNTEHKTGIPLSTLFLATTAVPEELANEPGAPMRNRKPTFAVEQPWGSETKDKLVKYIQENNLHVLIENSLSCTTLFSKVHCGKCWNCKERKWALNKNNIEELHKEQYA